MAHVIWKGFVFNPSSITLAKNRHARTHSYWVRDPGAPTPPRSVVLNSVVQPAHVNVFATDAAELDESVIMAKVKSASGSKSHVK